MKCNGVFEVPHNCTITSQWCLDLNLFNPSTLGHGLWLDRRPARCDHRPSEAAVQRQSDQTAVLHASLLSFRLLCPVLVHQAEVIGGRVTPQCVPLRWVSKRLILYPFKVVELNLKKEIKQIELWNISGVPPHGIIKT